MKSIVIITLFSFASLVSFGQNIEPTQASEKNTSTQTTEMKKAEKAPTLQPADPKDPYLGRQEKIKSIMKDGQIPTTFPKYIDGVSKEDYKQSVYTWVHNNQDLIKEEEYKKLEQKSH
jgi:hypothetical protein